MSVSIGVDRCDGRKVEKRAAEVEQRLAAALAGWHYGEDARLLRRALVELLGCLED